MIPLSFPSYEASMQFLNEALPMMPVELHAQEFGLVRVRKLLADLGDPQESLQTIHIAGTSGKGTTAYITAAILQAHGKKTGLSVSPYVYDMKERWQVNGRFISDDVVLEAVNRLMPLLVQAQAQQRLPSRFETLMCLTFLLMAEADIDYLVLETGMGGLLDASNVITRTDKVSIITSIGFDHMSVLGNSLPKIAAQKAGIISKSSYAFCFPQKPEIDEVFVSHAQEVQAQITWVKGDQESMPNNPLLRGTLPQYNWYLAKAALQYIGVRDGWSYDGQVASTVIENLQIPGRMEKLLVGDLTVVLDGAHNAQKIHALSELIKSEWPERSFAIGLTISRPDQADSILKSLASCGQQLFLLNYSLPGHPTKSPPAQSAYLNQAKRYFQSVEVITVNALIAEIFDADAIKNWLVTGSFYFLGEIKAGLQQT